MRSFAGRFAAVLILSCPCIAPALAQRPTQSVEAVGHPTASRAWPPERSTVAVPECKFAGDDIRVDLSTNIGAWTSNGPAQPGLGGPTPVSYGAWTANSGYWVQPFASSQVNSGALSGNYTYTLTFDLPCAPESYAALAIAGSIAADNTFQASLNGHPIASCANSNTCLSTTTQVSTQPSYFQPGPNVLTVEVVNTPFSKNPKTGLMTGLAAKLMLYLQCGRMCCTPLPRRR